MGEITNIISLASGAHLESTTRKNLLYDKYGKIYFYKKEDNSLIPLRSPSSGTALEMTNDEHIYHDKYAGLDIYLNDNGKMIPLVSPMSGRKLTINKDGTYMADGHKFILDERGILPTYIPDDTLEPAHVDGEYLVGNETGRRFPIKNDGKVVMPFDPIELDPKASPSEVQAYYDARKQRQYHETQAWIDAKIAEDEQADRMAMDAAIKRLKAEKLGTPIEQAKTNKFFNMVDEKLANGWELTEDEYAKLDIISKEGKLPDDAIVSYDKTYLYLNNLKESLKNNAHISNEDLHNLEVILNTGKLPEETETNSHTR